MRVNQAVFQQRQDMTGYLYVSDKCPSEFKEYAEKLLNLAAKPGFICPDYNTMTELHKLLILAYWKEYNGFNQSVLTPEKFDFWFVKMAEAPENIRRASQWLVTGNYFIVKESVRENALKAAQKYRNSVRAKV